MNRRKAHSALALAVTLVVVIEVKGVVLREVDVVYKQPPKQRSKATLGVSP